MREKNYNIELIRTISFILVIVIHVTNYFCRAFGRISAGEYGFALILDTFARVSVPCFFMISGAMLLGRNESLSKNWNRLIRFLPPLLFWSVVYYLFNTYYMGSDFELSEILAVPAEPHLWYLYAMIPIYLVLPFLQAMYRGMDDKLFGLLVILGTGVEIVMYVLSLFGTEPYYDVPLFGDRIYAYYFMLGYILWKYKDSARIRTRNLWIIFIASNVINIGLTAMISSGMGEHLERTLEYGCPFVMASAGSFFLLMVRAGNGQIYVSGPWKKRIDALCSCSFGIYLIHILFLDNYKKHLEAEAVSAWLAIPGLTVSILLVSFFSVYLIRKLPGGKAIT